MNIILYRTKVEVYESMACAEISPKASNGTLGLQPGDKVATLVVNTKECFLLNLHQNRVHFPVERNAFVLDHQHGHRDVTCKPAILWLYWIVNYPVNKLSSF